MASCAPGYRPSATWRVTSSRRRSSARGSRPTDDGVAAASGLFMSALLTSAGVYRVETRMTDLGAGTVARLTPAEGTPKMPDTSDRGRKFMAVDVRVVEVAARLTREQIGPRAATYDREAANPIESWRDLWEAGLLAAAVPRAHG